MITLRQKIFLIFLILSCCITVFAQNNNYLFIKAADQTSLGARIPLFLIHGWNWKGKPAAPTPEIWNNLINYINKDESLKSRYKLFYIYYWANVMSDLELAKVMGNKIDSIDNADANFADKKIVIIAHSMGGLISRSFMKQYKLNYGMFKDKSGGERVINLITLATPHHGSPLSNGPAKDAKINLSRKITMSFIENTVMSSVKYNDVNRTDLHWDNYDNLLDYNTYSDEKNSWLFSDLNGNNSYDSKIIAYVAKFSPQPVVFPSESSFLSMGGTILKEDFGMESDGLVPVNSANMYGHTVEKIRTFENYNHLEIVEGKSANDTALYNTLRTDLLRVLTSIKNTSSISSPESFELYQNYPNPFNPSTIISFRLPFNGLYSLKLYDVLGREIKILLDKYLESGKYEIEFESDRLSGGIYYYELKSANYKRTKTMVVLK